MYLKEVTHRGSAVQTPTPRFPLADRCLSLKDCTVSRLLTRLTSRSRSRDEKHSTPWAQYLFLFALLSGAATFLLYSNGKVDIDDALITYRYAQNLAHGKGFVYNEGERVLGTTTPLYTLVLALVRLTGLDIVLVSNLLGFLAGVGAVGLVYLLGQESDSPAIGWGGALFLALNGHFAAWAVSGMETSVYIFAILLAFIFYMRGHSMVATFMAAVSFLLRPDGALVFISIAPLIWCRSKRIPWREGLFYALLISPWILYAYIAFGSPVPNSLAAKQRYFALGPSWWMVSYFFQHSLVIYLPLAIVGLAKIFAGRQRAFKWLSILGWALIYILAYRLVRIPPYEWYMIPLLPVLAILASFGVEEISQTLAKAWIRYRGLPPKGLFYGLLIGLALLFTPLNVRAAQEIRGWTDGVDGTRARMAKWVRENYPFQTVIGASAIGHFGYWTESPLVDLVGLVTPYAMNHTALETIERYRPELILGLDGWPVPESRWDPGTTFLESYLPIRRYDIDGRFKYYIFQRVEEKVGGSRFGEEIELLDYMVGGVVQTKNERGEEGPIGGFMASLWRASESMDQDYTLYVHFTDPSDGTIVTQAHHLLGRQRWDTENPTSHWREGEIVQDIFFPIPPEVLASSVPLDIRVGLWIPETGEYLIPSSDSLPIDQYGRLVIGHYEPRSESRE